MLTGACRLHFWSSAHKKERRGIWSHLIDLSVHIAMPLVESPAPFRRGLHTPGTSHSALFVSPSNTSSVRALVLPSLRTQNKPAATRLRASWKLCSGVHLKVAVHATGVSNAVEVAHQGAPEPLSLALRPGAQQEQIDVAPVLLQWAQSSTWGFSSVHKLFEGEE